MRAGQLPGVLFSMQVAGERAACLSRQSHYGCSLWLFQTTTASAALATQPCNASGVCCRDRPTRFRAAVPVYSCLLWEPCLQGAVPLQQAMSLQVQVACMPRRPRAVAMWGGSRAAGPLWWHTVWELHSLPGGLQPADTLGSRLALSLGPLCWAPRIGPGLSLAWAGALSCAAPGLGHGHSAAGQGHMAGKRWREPACAISRTCCTCGHS